LTDQRKVSREKAIALAQQLNVSYMETSALNASNVEQAFGSLVQSIYYKKIPKSMENSTPASAEYVPTKTVPIESEPEVDIARPQNQKSFRVGNNQASTKPKKTGCC
jgi:hypothetical protein